MRRFKRRHLFDAGLLGVYALGLGWLTLVYLNYPVGNDLDEIGWLAANLSTTRLESFANENYPFGFVLLLRLTTPLFGSLLRAAFAIQILAMVCVLSAGYRIAKAIYEEAVVGFAAAVTIAVFTLPFATSEFADGTATAFLLCGMAALLSNKSTTRGSFLFGLSIGCAFLFRFHYLMLVPIGILMSLLLARRGIEKLQAVAVLVGGFVLAALPLLIINSIEHGNPTNTGLSSYVIGHFVMPSSLDWTDFPATYTRWPVGRVLAEGSQDLIRHVTVEAWYIWALPVVKSATVLLVPAFWYARKQGAWRELGALLLFCGFYTALVVVPTRFTTRAFHPVVVVLSIVVAAGLFSCRAIPRGRRWWIAAPVTAALVMLSLGLGRRSAASLVNGPAEFWRDVTARRGEMLYNRQILAVLGEHGFEESTDVFTNDWDVFNLDDPKFDTFVNYGGWILLDSKYAAERPRPTARTATEWKDYFVHLGIKLVVLDPVGPSASNIADIIRQPEAAGLEPVYSDSVYHIYKRVGS